MKLEPGPAKLLHSEQFRMRRLQVFNWGTFSDLHDIPVSERGFLIVGRSGAGKSTLLDAFSALLIPPRWIDFNAAARETERAGRDRNLVTYVRGAWAAQSDSVSGEYAMRYLRTGTTWSALALSYRNGAGQEVVLVQLFWVRGNANGSSDVKRYYLILERPFDLRELGDFGSNNFDVRKLKQALPEAYARDEFRPYCERFCRLLGIENEMALRLLHKTQSAKNLGDLNTFLRDFMLDKPETFAVADRLVSEFGELNAAHAAVVTARQQVQTLAPARSRYQQKQSLQMQRNALEELRAGMNSYREQRRMTLLREQISLLHVEAEAAAGRVQRQAALLENRSEVLSGLEQQRRAAGGEHIELLEKERKLKESQRDERMRKREQAVGACKGLDWDFAGSPEGFAGLSGRARQEIEEWQLDDRAHDAMMAMAHELAEARSRQAAVTQEVNSLRRQPSSIPAPMLAMRRELAQAIGAAESVLPFVGELIEVKAEEAQWRGAIERVLRGFALSILVDEDHYAALSAHVNEVDLGRKLVYLRATRPDTPQARALPPNSLVLKLNVQAGSFADWLRADLRKRFDYDCVESIRAFRAAPERALTREGQVRHSRSRHEKDDSSRIDERRNWVLGFDNREKLALYEQQERELKAKVGALESQLTTLRNQTTERAKRLLHCQTLVNLQWQEIDVLPVVERIAAIDRQLKSIGEGNAALRKIDERLREQDKLVQEARAALRMEEVSQLECKRSIDKHGQQLAALEQDPSIVPLTPLQRQGLDERYTALPEPVRLQTLDAADRAVARAIGNEVEGINAEIAECVKFIEAQFATFNRNWRADADGLDASMAAAPDYFGKLARLETDGLPAHEQRFFELLQNQSHQNLTALSAYLTNARKAILERMELVNESLRQVPFNQGPDFSTYLHIQPDDRQLPEVREFKQEILGVLNNAWSDAPELAEERFVALRRLVDRLASQDPEHRRWREAVLDVRLHVDFIGREMDENGAEIEAYRSGAGKSGGQRQKLATTCLAAALRYQLGGSETGVPMYAPVVLDEAFDKADNEFTALAMNIFANFGFQMIVATPLKSVMTLEPFIGGACFVDIRDRRVSGVLLIEYDDERKRLNLPEQARIEASLEAAG